MACSSSPLSQMIEAIGLPKEERENELNATYDERMRFMKSGEQLYLLVFVVSGLTLMFVFVSRTLLDLTR